MLEEATDLLEEAKLLEAAEDHWKRMAEQDLHVRIEPGESGLPRVSYAMPEMVRSISTERFGRHFGVPTGKPSNWPPLAPASSSASAR